MSKIEYIKPTDIEDRSFEIIDEELKARGIVLDPKKEPIIKRAIHTTADFDYVDTLKFSENAVDIAIDLLKKGANIVTDTTMVFSGVNKTSLGKLGGECICYMNDPDINYAALDLGVTRASLSMKRASKLEGPLIYAIGNAPTALITLHELMQTKNYRPDFIIGVPVGFVNVEASKELFLNSDIPYIINKGRKGGSNVAAAICNALIYSITKAK